MNSPALSTISSPHRLLTLAGCFDYPSAARAGQLRLPPVELENSYVRLFINSLGGVKAPPYAGCYLDGRDRRQFMIEFSGLCRQYGIVLGPSQPPDYIPAMLEALALLLADCSELPEIYPHDSVPVPALLTLLNDFYRHWPELFATALKEHDQTGYYAAAAAALQDTLATLRQTTAASLTTN